MGLRRPFQLARSTFRFSIVALCTFSIGCALVAGIDGYNVTDAVDGSASSSSSGSMTDATTGTSSGGGDSSHVVIEDGGATIPIGCDPTKNNDDACLQLPPGWKLVAITAKASATLEGPACPDGLAIANDVGTSATAQSNACTCNCNVVLPASCQGPLTNSFGTNVACSNQQGNSYFRNQSFNGCNSDTPNSLSDYQKFKLPDPSGGVCTPGGSSTQHPERIDVTNPARLCDNTTRCNPLGICDARVIAPFQACIVSSDSNATCPAPFTKKQVLGPAGFTCSACNCAITRTPCVGSVLLYKQDNCNNNPPVAIPADNTCRNLPSSGGGPAKDYESYKVDASTTTTCSGTSQSTNVGITTPRTICCR